MSQNQKRLQTEIFHKKPYLWNYFQIFEKKYNYVSLEEENKGSDSLSDYSVGSSKTGLPILFYKNKPLASNYDPAKQALRQLESVPIRDQDLVVVMGIGNLSVLELLHKSRKPNQIILCIDLSEDLVPLLWNHGLEEFLRVPGRHIFSGESFIPLLWNYMDGLNIEHLSGIKFLYNPASMQLFPEIYSELENKLSGIFSSKMSDLLTKFEFETLWISNIIKNTIRYSEGNLSYKIESLRDALQGIPALLVSAGPSLRKEIEWIRKIRDKVFLLSCDTSLKVLLKSGIRPDGVYTLDAQMNSFFHFLGEDLTGIPLFADMVTSPYMIENLNPESLIFSMTAKYVNTVEGELKREVTAGGEFSDEFLGNIGDIQSGGSVATTAFDALRYMGVTNFYFLGQDLAYTGREIHSTGTHHNEKWMGLINRRKSLELINELVVRKRDTRYVESISGREVLTDYVLDLYRSWFEESVQSLHQQNKDYSFYNIGEKGARIQGMENISSTQAEKSLEDQSSHHYSWKTLPPWQNSLSHSSGLSHNPKQSPSRLKITSDLQELRHNLDLWKDDPHFTEKMRDWFQTRSYLRRIYRKAQTYVGRHRDKLSEERKNALIYQALDREWRRLARNLYPILGPSFLGGDKSLES